MPVISLFQGIIVLMFYQDTKQHHLPHIHVKYTSLKAFTVFLMVNYSKAACLKTKKN